MYELPQSMNTKFRLYLNILPIAQDVAIYSLFVGGAILLLCSIGKILLYQPKGTTSNSQWCEAEMQRQRLSFLNEKEPTIKMKEMDVYYNSLLSPQNEDATFIGIEDLPGYKEEMA